MLRLRALALLPVLVACGDEAAKPDGDGAVVGQEDAAADAGGEADGATPGDAEDEGDVQEPLSVSVALLSGKHSEDGTHVIGKPGAVEPVGASVEIAILHTGEVVRAQTDDDGAFDVAVGDIGLGAVEVRVVQGARSSAPVYVFGASTGDDIARDANTLGCDERSLLASLKPRGVAAAADHRCETAADCAVVSLKTACGAWCGPALVSTGAAADVSAARTLASDTLCASADTCAPVESDCKPVADVEPVCVSNRCVVPQRTARLRFANLRFGALSITEDSVYVCAADADGKAVYVGAVAHGEISEYSDVPLNAAGQLELAVLPGLALQPGTLDDSVCLQMITRFRVRTEIDAADERGTYLFADPPQSIRFFDEAALEDSSSTEAIVYVVNGVSEAHQVPAFGVPGEMCMPNQPRAPSEPYFVTPNVGAGDTGSFDFGLFQATVDGLCSEPLLSADTRPIPLYVDPPLHVSAAPGERMLVTLAPRRDEPAFTLPTPFTVVIAAAPMRE